MLKNFRSDLATSGISNKRISDSAIKSTTPDRMLIIDNYVSSHIKVTMSEQSTTNQSTSGAHIESRYAILVVDMLNDFVHGKLKCERAQSISLEHKTPP